MVSHLTQQEEDKVRKLQKFSLFYLSGLGTGTLQRKPVLERLLLELELQRGLRLLFLCICMFITVIYAAMVESQSTVRMGALKTFKSIFHTQGLADINTREEFTEYLEFVSEQSRKLMPLSSNHFVEEYGEVKMLAGLSEYAANAPRTLKMDGLPRVNSKIFTFLAWIKLSPGTGAVVIEKPLGSGPEYQNLVCWQWYVGSPSDKISYGAHDFGGDPENADAQQVVASAGLTNCSDGNLHMVAVVVNQTFVSFFTDAVLIAEVPLKQPVTDCINTRMRVGRAAASIPTLGEMTFFPRPLTDVQMKEIMATGSTYQAIAYGKKASVAQNTNLDDLRNSQDENFEDAKVQREDTVFHLQVQQVFTRAPPSQSDSEFLTSHPTLSVEKSHTCRQIDAFGSPPCNIVQDIGEAITEDVLLPGRGYHELFTPQLRGGRDSQQSFYMPSETGSENLNYNISKIPSWCGKNVSFAFWVANRKYMYLLNKYEAATKQLRDRYWYIDKAGNYMTFAMFNPTKSGKRTNARCRHPKAFIISKAMRHFAVVMDVENDFISFYADGELVCKQDHKGQSTEGWMREMDCQRETSDSYSGVGGRPPGVHGGEALVRDWRVYIGQALSVEEVRTLALGSGERECKLPVEGFDTPITDLVGNDCSWYQDAREKFRGICADPKISSGCPVACQSATDCFVPEGEESTKQYRIFNKITRVDTKSTHYSGSVLYAPSGFDPVHACRHYVPSNDDIDTWQRWWREFYGPGRDVNITDCAEVEQALSPISLPISSWNDKVHAEIAKSGGYTVSFWMRINNIPQNANALPDAKFRMWIFSSLYPVRPLFRMKGGSTSVNLQIFTTCERYDNVDVSVPEGLQTDRWYFVAISYGVERNGLKAIQLMIDTRANSDYLDSPWCAPDWSQSPKFIEGILLTKGTMISPIDITSTGPVPLKHLQTLYYSQLKKIRLRMGPSVSDEDRMAKPIEYDRRIFTSPLALIAPPIILQERKTSSSQCNNDLGTSYLNNLWNTTVSGVQCSFPFKCDAMLLQSASNLVTCVTDETRHEVVRDKRFFGKSPQLLNGKTQAWEFLQSIADAEVLVRDGDSFYTKNFIDQMTSAVTIVLTTFAPQHGIASFIAFTADFSSDVTVDYKVSHFQTLENAELQRYRTTIIVGLVLAVIIAMEKVATLRHKSWSEVKVSFACDMIIQVILPISYFCIRYTQVSSSKDTMKLAMGEQGLMGVPWESNSIDPDEKVRSFFEGLEKFSRIMETEFFMTIFYFAHATVALLRLLMQTGAHPRLSILVGTLIGAADDLWHFLILLLVVMGGFLALAMAQFSGEQEYFGDVKACFQTLYGFMLGNLPAESPNSSENWGSNPLILAYVLMYNVIVFMVMLNFIIAIIVIAHQDVWTKVRDMESDQEFFSDMFSVLRQAAMSWYHSWPNHIRLIQGLGDKNLAIAHVQYIHLRNVFPEWRSRNSIKAFIQYYSRHRHDEKDKDEARLEVKSMFQDLQQTLSVMLGVPVPSLLERILQEQEELNKKRGKRNLWHIHAKEKGGNKDLREPQAITYSLVPQLSSRMQNMIAESNTTAQVTGHEIVRANLPSINLSPEPPPRSRRMEEGFMV